jgi:hypothetical protein
MEIARRDDNLGTRNALDAVTPTARRLDRCLHRFRSGVHRQCDIETRQLAKLLDERTEAIVVIGARRHRETLCLLRELCNDAWMGMAMTRRRIGAHHIDVTPSRYIP